MGKDIVNCHFERCYKRQVDLPEDRVFRASAIAGKCPYQYFLKLTMPTEGKESDESTMDWGTKLHNDDEWELDGAKGVIASEKYYLIQRRKEYLDPEEGQWYLKGSMDKLRIHPELGLFVEDVKTKRDEMTPWKIKSLLENKEKLQYGWDSYVPQLSIYAFYEFVYNKQSNLKARIRFIDQTEPLRQIAEPVELWDWSGTQEFIEEHPTVRAILLDDPQIAKDAVDFPLDQKKFPCGWCNYSPCELYFKKQKRLKVKKPPITLTEDDLEGLSGGEV